MKKFILLFIAITTVMVAKAQQDTQFSQYIFNSIYINPAYTGYKEDTYVQSYFRSQWVGVAGAPKSFSIAADGLLDEKNVGLGITLSSDQIGAQSSLTGYFNYSYRIRIGEDETSHLAFGLAAGLMQLGIDGTKLNAVQIGDPTVPISSASKMFPDANFGVYYANKDYFLGFSATNILATYLQGNNAYNVLVPVPQPHFYLSGGTLLSVNDNLKFKPVFLLKDDLKGPTTLDLDGFLLFNERISFGAFYRSSIKLYQKSNLQNDLPSQNAFGAIAEFFATPNIRIGYSYDQALTNFGSNSYGSHELSIGFYIDRSRSGSDGSPRCYKF